MRASRTYFRKTRRKHIGRQGTCAQTLLCRLPSHGEQCGQQTVPQNWSVVIRLRRGLGGFSGIDQIAELFRWLEVRNALGRDFYSLAGLWIAANSGIALANSKRAKAADFDFVAALQRRDHGIKYGLHDDLAIA